MFNEWIWKKVGKLPIVASYTCNCISKLLRGQEYGGFLLHCTKILLTLFCWKSQLWVNSNIESVFIATQHKENKILCIANEEMGATTFDPL